MKTLLLAAAMIAGTCGAAAACEVTNGGIVIRDDQSSPCYVTEADGVGASISQSHEIEATIPACPTIGDDQEAWKQFRDDHPGVISCRVTGWNATDVIGPVAALAGPQTDGPCPVVRDQTGNGQDLHDLTCELERAQLMCASHAGEERFKDSCAEIGRRDANAELDWLNDYLGRTGTNKQQTTR